MIAQPTSRIPRITLNRDEAAEAIGVSVRTIDSLIADRSSGFPYMRIGARILIPVDSLKAWCSQRLGQSTPSPTSHQSFD